MMWQTSKDKYTNAADVVYSTDKKNITEEIMELKQVILDYYSSHKPEPI